MGNSISQNALSLKGQEEGNIGSRHCRLSSSLTMKECELTWNVIQDV